METDSSTDLNENDSNTDKNTDTNIIINTDSGNYIYDTEQFNYSNLEICKIEETNLILEPVAMMILQDISGSMDSPYKWGVVLPVLTDMLNTYKESNFRFGLDFFPDDKYCGVSAPIISDCKEDKTMSSEIISAISSGVIPEGATPLYEAMTTFLDDSYAPGFTSKGKNRILLIVSDGEDTCGKKQVLTEATIDDFIDVTQSLLVKGIKTLTIGFGSGFNSEQLDTISANGGTEITTHISADDKITLQNALTTVSGEVSKCEFDVPVPNDTTLDNSDQINFSYGDKIIPHHEGCVREEGWTWYGNDKDRTVRVCTTTCDDLKKTNEKIIITWGCPTIEISID
ncbi:MAG: VWA domain-containing protein [Deltaproteobacteria bacterium]|nr:VWA domain-containing protein [Deltaproteobacteria bacterium]